MGDSHFVKSLEAGLGLVRCVLLLLAKIDGLSCQFYCVKTSIRVQIFAQHTVVKNEISKFYKSESTNQILLTDKASLFEYYSNSNIILNIRTWR